MSNKKFSKIKNLILSDKDIQLNVTKQLFQFECDLRELFKKWTNTLEREEINAHISWICSEAGNEFLVANSALAATDLFNYMSWAQDRYEGDQVNDPGSELCDSLQYLLEEEFVIENA